ncbi:metalloprotease MEP1 [Metarhizium brunneum]
MVMLPLLVSGLMAAVSVAGPMDMRAVGHHCATRSLSLEERQLFEQQTPQQRPLPDDGQEINLGFVLHFCCGGGSQCPSDSVAEKTVEDMNGLFANGKIKFNLQNVSRIADPRCTSEVTDNRAMDQLKSQVRQGNTSTLNIVYVPARVNSPQANVVTVKGVCVVPPKGGNISEGMGDVDGCVVTMDTLPKGNSSNGGNGGNGVNSGNGGNGRLQGNYGSSRRLGGLFGRLFSRQDGGGGGGNAHISGTLATSVHETGHWLGELHANGGGGVGGTVNVMVPVMNNDMQYSFSADQFKRMRQTALARVNDQNSPVANTTATGPVDGGVNTHPHPHPHPPFGNGDDVVNTGGQGNPVRPTNPGFNPIGNGNGGDNTGGQGNPVGPTNPDFNPASGRPATGNFADFWAYIKQILGDRRVSGFEVSRIGARAEPEAEADESGLVHIARREGTEAEADASGLVHIARRDDAGEPDGSGLVHIARK